MTFSSKSTATLLALVSLVSIAAADLKFASGDGRYSSLQQFGSAEAQLSLLLATTSGEQVLESALTFVDKQKAKDIVSEHKLEVTQISSTSYNVSVSFVFEGWVGDVDYTVAVRTMERDSGLHRSYALEGKHSVYGIVLYETDKAGKKTIVSGDEAEAVKYVSFKDALVEGRQLGVAAHGPTSIKPSEMSVRVRALVGAAESKLLTASGVSIQDDGISLTLNKYRVGKALVTLEHDGLELHGESFETQFVVEVGDEPRPPPVVSGGDDVEAELLDGDEEGTSFTLTMYNLGGLSSVTAVLDGRTFTGTVGDADEGLVRFSGEAMRGGRYTAELMATREGGEVVAVVTLAEVEVTFGGRRAGTGHGGVSGVTVGAWAGGAAGLLILVVGVVAVFAAWRSRRMAAAAESSFATSGMSSWGDGDVPAALSIQRDVYGRGSLAAEEAGVATEAHANGNGSRTGREEDPQFWRV